MNTILTPSRMTHQNDLMFTILQQIANGCRYVFEISGQATGAEPHVAASHVKLTETPIDGLKFGGKPLNVRCAHVTLLMKSTEVPRSILGVKHTSVNPAINSKQEEDEQSPLSKIVRAPCLRE